MLLRTAKRIFGAVQRLALTWSDTRLAAHPILVALFCLLLAGCCDLRWSIDSATGPTAYTPTVVGNPRFVLEVYGYPNFDHAHRELGQRFISMRERELRPIGQNYARSLILKSTPNTTLQITTENGHRGRGKVGPNRQLKIADICYGNNDGSYKTDGNLSCNIKSIVIRQPSR